MDFDAIEPSRFGSLRTFAKLLNNAGDFRRIQSTIESDWHPPILGEGDAVIRNGRRPYGYCAVGHVDVGGPAHMPKLQEDLSTLGMDDIGDSLPSRHLLVGVNTWRTKITPSGNRHGGSLGDNETTFGGALTVILDHEISGDVARLIRTHSRERCHDHAVG